MSLYPQSYYGQPTYGGPGFSAPAPQTGYHYAYSQQPAQPIPHPPPPSVHFIDPATFRRDYSSRLDQLQFNSRPIIQSLSFYAQEYSRYADVVAQCLESHIRKVPPWMKLPAFYLLDAISKNVYEPYARIFAAFVIPLFLETYKAVDDNTRSKMDEMLLTWRTGSPTGKELFGLTPQIAIERGIWGDQAGPGQITKPQVMSELNFALQAKERAVQANPNDVTAKHHMQVLLQLRSLVEAGVSQEELNQILAQLRALVRPPLVQQPPVGPPASQSQWTTSTSFIPQQTSTVYPTPTAPYTSVTSVLPSLPQVKAEPPILTSLSTPANETLGAPAEQTQLNISNILSTLMKSGLVSAPQANNFDASESAQEEPKSAPSEADLTAIKEARREYRMRILKQDVRLSTVDITRTRPAIPDLLYDYLSVQCKQCGARYPDTTMGRKSLEDHLDMHFRQNRKLSQSLGRGHSRSWFISVEDWVHEPCDIKGKTRPVKAGSSHEKAVTGVEKAKREAELRSQYIAVPNGDEAKPMSCPICKEALQVEFLEDEEEWVWRNAVKRDDRIFHATCHAEAAASTNNLVARLKNEMGTGSRGSTPEIMASRMTPPPVRVIKSRSPSRSPSSTLAGTKRKVDYDGLPESLEADRTPPSKKLALAQS